MLLDRQTAGIVGYLPQCPVERKVYDVADSLEVLSPAHIVLRRPRTLRTKRRLEICLRALEVPQHEDAGPGPHGHACRELAAGKRNRPRLERIVHRLLYRLKRRRTHSGRCARADDYLVGAVKRILPRGKEIGHRMAARDVRQKPQRMREDSQ